MSEYSNHLDFFEYDRKIERYLNFNINKYKYLGDEGNEYEVIQSVFHEINELEGLTDRQIRWYAVIIHLVGSFCRQRQKGQVPDMSLPGTSPGVKTGAGINKALPVPVYVPPYIESLEVFIQEVARLGVLFAANEPFGPHYLSCKLGRIQSFFIKILRCLAAGEPGQAGDDVYVLTIQRAVDNLVRLEESLLEKGELKFERSMKSELYERVIGPRLAGISEERLAGFHNMEAFWNGFIP